MLLIVEVGRLGAGRLVLGQFGGVDQSVLSGRQHVEEASRVVGAVRLNGRLRTRWRSRDGHQERSDDARAHAPREPSDLNRFHRRFPPAIVATAGRGRETGLYGQFLGQDALDGRGERYAGFWSCAPVRRPVARVGG